MGRQFLQSELMADIAPPIPITPYIDNVLTHVETLSHWRRRLFVKNRMRADYPRFFYKFFPIDPHEAKSIGYLRDMLVESRFWLADHRQFNDPFDLKANVAFEGTRAEKERRLKALIANQSAGAPRKARKEMLVQMMARSDEEWVGALEEIFRNRANDIGVCSFATDTKPFPGRRREDQIPAPTTTVRLGPRSILMWAHYGRSHEGVCLQFETILCPRVFTYAQQVEYSEEYPRVNYVSNLEESLLVPLTRKHKGWHYENEWRLLHMQGARTYLPFDPAALRRLIVGCRAPAATYAAVVSLLDERKAKGRPPVRLLRAVQHPREYKLLLWSLRERN
jgi:hypothetical protein